MLKNNLAVIKLFFTILCVNRCWSTANNFWVWVAEFCDAIREGDGERVLRCWRYLLPVFKSSGRKNYSIEVLNMLCQFQYELTPRHAQELIWSRFVSTHESTRTEHPK